MSIEEIVQFKYSEECSSKNRPQLKRILASQVFTPCGRYGISLPIDYGIREENVSPITLPVIDFFERKLSHYRYEANVHNQCDIIYCLDSTTLVSIRAKQRGFAQKVWRLNHQEKTVEIVSTRSYRHKIDSPEMLDIHEKCQKDLHITFKGKSHNIWISAKPYDSGHHLVFLLPRNPFSAERLKLFYLDLSKLPSSDNDVAQHYNLNQHGSPYFPPTVTQSSLWFPASTNGKQVFGLWLSINLEDLENLIDSEHVDLGIIAEMQRPDYRTFLIFRDESETLEEQYPALETDHFAGDNYSVHWEKQKDDLSHCRIMTQNLTTRNIWTVSTRLSDFETMVMHPHFGVFIWSLTPGSLQAAITNARYKKAMEPLFQIARRNLFWQKFSNFDSIPGYNRIMFN